VEYGAPADRRRIASCAIAPARISSIDFVSSRGESDADEHPSATPPPSAACASAGRDPDGHGRGAADAPARGPDLDGLPVEQPAHQARARLELGDARRLSPARTHRSVAHPPAE